MSVATKSVKPLYKKIAFPLLTFLALALGGFAYYRLVLLPKQASAARPTYQTARAVVGNLSLTASGSGTLVAADEKELVFTTGGQVKTVLVKMGDQVNAGDLLAEVDDTDARVAYEQARRSLAELTSPAAIAAAQKAVGDAETQVTKARLHLEYLISPDVMYWETEIEKAEHALKKARNKAETSPGDAAAKKDLDEVKAYLDFSKNQLALAWEEYHEYVLDNFTVRGPSGKTTVKPTDLEIVEARAAIADARTALKENQYLYAVLTGGEIPEGVTGAALTELEQARLDLNAAQKTLDGTRIYAPISGTVVYIGASMGDTVKGQDDYGDSATVMVTVVDLASQACLDFYLDETDWDVLAVGETVEAVFKVDKDKVFTGKVIEVDPNLSVSGDEMMGQTKLVNGLAQLDVTFDELNLPLGTSVTVTVTGKQASGVTLIPVEALHETDDGGYAVYVLTAGQFVERLVEIGLQNDSYAEVKSGLQAGEMVVTGNVVSGSDTTVMP